MADDGAKKRADLRSVPLGDSEAARAPKTWVDALYRDHFRELLAFVIGKVGQGPPDPEDITQDAFESVAKHRAPETIVNKRAYLYRAAANEIMTFRRRAAVRHKHAVRDFEVQKIFGEGDGLTPERVLLDRESIKAVMLAVDAMPARRRRLLLLNRVEGLSYAAIGRRFDVTEKTVRMQVKKAIEELVQYAPGYDDANDEDDTNEPNE